MPAYEVIDKNGLLHQVSFKNIASPLLARS